VQKSQNGLDLLELHDPNFDIVDITTCNCPLYAIGYIELYILVLIHLLEVEAFSQGQVTGLLVFHLVHLAADLRALPSSVFLHSVISQSWDVKTVRRPG